MEVNLCVYGKVYKTETKLSRKAQSEKVSLSVQDSSLNYVMFYFIMENTQICDV